MITTAAKFLLNRMSGVSQRAKLGQLLDRTTKCVSATYDFSVSGGAQGDITLLTDALPANAIVLRVFHSELTNVTSGGAATGTLKAGSTALTGAIALATFSSVASEALAGAVGGIKITDESDLKLTIGTADYTAGKVRFFVEYVVDQDTTNTY